MPITKTKPSGIDTTVSERYRIRFIPAWTIQVLGALRVSTDWVKLEERTCDRHLNCWVAKGS